MLGIEEEILGSLILEPDNVAKLVISDEHFEDADNQFIFKLLKRQYSDDKTISLTGLFEKYKHLFNQRFPQDRILSKVVKISTDAMGTDFEYNQEILFEKYVNRLILGSIDKFKNSKITQDELLADIHKFEALTIKSSANKLTSNEIFKLINSKNKNIKFRFNKLAKYSNIQDKEEQKNVVTYMQAFEED